MILLDMNPEKIAEIYGLPLEMECGACKAKVKMERVFRTQTTLYGLCAKEDFCKCGTTAPFCGTWPEDFLTK